MSQHLSPETKLSLLYKWFHTCGSSRDIRCKLSPWVLPLEPETLKSVDGKAPRGLAQTPLHRLSLKGHDVPGTALCARNIFVQRNTRGHGYSPEWHVGQIYRGQHRNHLNFWEPHLLPWSPIFFSSVSQGVFKLKDKTHQIETRSPPNGKGSVSTTDVVFTDLSITTLWRLCLCFLYGDKWGNQG